MNSFGPPNYPYPLYDPREARESRARFRRDALPALERANGFYCPAGRWPSRGWILLARADYDRIDRYAVNLQLNVGDTTAPDNVRPLNNLAIVQARCVTRGLAADPAALYLVEITDGRGVLANEWFQFPLVAAYNIRAPAYPQTFMPATMNSGTTWTWATMLQDIWTRMAAFLGAWPGLPLDSAGAEIAPAGTPEGFWFSGVPAWQALNDVLDHLGFSIAADLTSSSAPYTIVDDSAADATFLTAQTRYLTHLEDDAEWIDAGAARVPQTVRVLFRRRNSVYGTEETTPYRNDVMAYQWSTNAVYEVAVGAPVTFASATGTHYLWSDFTVRFDDSGNPLAADTATALAIAQERVTRYFARIYHGTAGSMSQTYAGALPFATGSQVDGVCWHHDYSGGWQGWRTQIVRGQSPPWEGIW